MEKTSKLAIILQEFMSRYGHGSYFPNNVNLMELIQITVTEQQITQGWCKNEKKKMMQ